MISEFVEYVKQTWKNKPNVSSPLNADRLNHMEAGIENNSKKIKETVTAVNELTEKCKNLNLYSPYVDNTGSVSINYPLPANSDTMIIFSPKHQCEVGRVTKDGTVSKFSSYKVSYSNGKFTISELEWYSHAVVMFAWS